MTVTDIIAGAGKMGIGHYGLTDHVHTLFDLPDMQSRGVALALGSDCHLAAYHPDFETAAQMLQSVGVRHEDLWLLPPRPRR